MLVNSVLVLLWLSFLFLWSRVNQFTSLTEALHSIGYLGGMIAIYGAILALWVGHNIRIWRKKGPRLSLRDVSGTVRQDLLSREILPLADLMHEQDIEVTVEGNYKVFVSAANRDLTLNPDFSSVGAR